MNLIIEGYTREAGVRELERNLGSVCRNVAVDFSKFKDLNTNSENKFSQLFINTEKVAEVLGHVVFEDDIRDRLVYPGIAIGMAWTNSGGKILYVEASKSRGKGRV